MKLGDIATDVIIDSRKLTEYALDPNNPKGADKAVMFEHHLGFTKDNYQLLLDKIKSNRTRCRSNLAEKRYSRTKISSRFKNNRNSARATRNC